MGERAAAERRAATMETLTCTRRAISQRPVPSHLHACFFVPAQKMDDTERKPKRQGDETHAQAFPQRWQLEICHCPSVD